VICPAHYSFDGRISAFPITTDVFKLALWLIMSPHYIIRASRPWFGNLELTRIHFIVNDKTAKLNLILCLSDFRFGECRNLLFRFDINPIISIWLNIRFDQCETVLSTVIWPAGDRPIRQGRFCKLLQKFKVYQILKQSFDFIYIRFSSLIWVSTFHSITIYDFISIHSDSPRMTLRKW
jgi:hypothetical protein